MQVSHALPMPGKSILHLTDSSRVIKKFSIAQMQAEVVPGFILPTQLQSFASVQLSRGLYLLCGNSSTLLLNGLDKKITKKADMLESREEFGLALSPCRRYAFAFGGFSRQGNCCLTSVERYTISSDRWEVVTKLGAPMKAMSVATLPDGLYLMGGYNANVKTYTRRVLRLDTQTLYWKQMSDMMVARGCFTASSAGTCDFIYAVGGFSSDGASTHLVERFDVQRNRWEMVAPLNTARFMHASCLSTIFAAD